MKATPCLKGTVKNVELPKLEPHPSGSPTTYEDDSVLDAIFATRERLPDQRAEPTGHRNGIRRSTSQPALLTDETRAGKIVETIKARPTSTNSRLSIIDYYLSHASTDVAELVKPGKKNIHALMDYIIDHTYQYSVIWRVKAAQFADLCKILKVRERDRNLTSLDADVIIGSDYPIAEPARAKSPSDDGSIVTEDGDDGSCCSGQEKPEHEELLSSAPPERTSIYGELMAPPVDHSDHPAFRQNKEEQPSEQLVLYGSNLDDFGRFDRPTLVVSSMGRPASSIKRKPRSHKSLASQLRPAPILSTVYEASIIDVPMGPLDTTANDEGSERPQATSSRSKQRHAKSCKPVDTNTPSLHASNNRDPKPHASRRSDKPPRHRSAATIGNNHSQLQQNGTTQPLVTTESFHTLTDYRQQRAARAREPVFVPKDTTNYRHNLWAPLSEIGKNTKFR